ncbi:hypothetical protein Xen7305DRAFT_00035130, partial [Xenococcus sp. PCC 7305]
MRKIDFSSSDRYLSFFNYYFLLKLRYHK